MRILVDGQALQADHVRGRGIGRYTSNFLDGLVALENKPSITLVLQTHLPAPDLLSNSLEILNYSSDPYSKNLSDPDEQVIEEQKYGDWLATQGFDWILIPNPMDYELLVPRFRQGTARVCAIHYDLIPFLFHTVYLKNPGYFQAYARRLRQVLSMDLLLSISETSTRDLIRYFPETQGKVLTISGATDPFFASESKKQCQAAELRESLPLDRDFLFHLGGPEPRKNLDGAIRALGHLVHDHQQDLLLVLVCNPHSEEKTALERLAKECGVGDRLRLLPRMNDEELRWLYEHCRVFLFPSYYEGLGLPILEAQQVGAPVALSNTSSLPEFAGPGVELFDPANPAEIAKSVKRLLERPREAGQGARKDFANQFSWGKTASLALAAWHSHKAIPAARSCQKVAILMATEVLTTMKLDDIQATLTNVYKEFPLELVIDAPWSTFPRQLTDTFPTLRLDEFKNRQEMGVYDGVLVWNADGILSDFTCAGTANQPANWQLWGK